MLRFLSSDNEVQKAKIFFIQSNIILYIIQHKRCVNSADVIAMMATMSLCEIYTNKLISAPNPAC